MIRKIITLSFLMAAMNSFAGESINDDFSGPEAAAAVERWHLKIHKDHGTTPKKVHAGDQMSIKNIQPSSSSYLALSKPIDFLVAGKTYKVKTILKYTEGQSILRIVNGYPNQEVKNVSEVHHRIKVKPKPDFQTIEFEFVAKDFPETAEFREGGKKKSKKSKKSKKKKKGGESPELEDGSKFRFILGKVKGSFDVKSVEFNLVE